MKEVQVGEVRRNEEKGTKVSRRGKLGEVIGSDGKLGLI